jgi:HD-like signal output (HDOD) protein
MPYRLTPDMIHSNSTKLKDLLSGAQLPALPQSAIRLLELSHDPNNGPAEFTLPIEADPGLAGQVLKFVNSSYFGFSREIASVKLAITLVGVRTIKNFALWSAVFSLMPNPKCGPFDLKSLWQDSLRRGLFARGLGRALKLKEAEDLFAAALLQDMAVPLLAKELPSNYNRLLEDRRDGKVRLSDLEQAEFGWTHAQAAGIMARTWRLPENFATLIEEHAKYDPTSSREFHPSLAAVALSALLPSTQDGHWAELEAFRSGFARLKGINVALPQLLSDVDRDFAEFAPVLKLAVPARSLVEFLPSAAAASKAN